MRKSTWLSLLAAVLSISVTGSLLAGHSAGANTTNLLPSLIWPQNGTETVCSMPAWTATSNIMSTSAMFSWSPVSGAESYSVQTRVLNGTWYDAPGSPYMSTSVTVSGFIPNTTYQWRVRTNCMGGDYSNWTYPVTFTTTGGSCDPPDTLYTTNITQTSATWHWGAVNGAQTYTIQWRLPGGVWYILSGGPFPYTSVHVVGFNPNTTYEWRVRSNCGYNSQSDWSYVTSFTTLGSSCGTPSGLYVNNITTNSATFNWAPVTGAVSYSLQTRLPGGTWSYAQGSPYNSTSVTIGGFASSTTYEWRVRANCGGGAYGAWTDPLTFTTLAGPSCLPPSWLSTINIMETSATFTWAPVSGANSYSVQWRHPGGTWYNLSGGPYYTTWINVIGFQPNTTYEWRVRSNCSNYDYSDWSSPTSFTTLGYSCQTPTWPYTSNISSTSATFHWDAMYGAQSYQVQIRTPYGQWYDIPGNPFTSNWATVDGLQPNTDYQWRVRACCGLGSYSYWTYPICFTTTGGSCNAPYWLSTINVTQNSATLSWSSVSGAVSYSVQYRIAGGTWYDVPGGPFTNNWANLTGLQPGTQYEWRVRSCCGYGMYSDWSYIAYFTTDNAYNCNTPTWPVTLDITSTSAKFKWDAVYGAQSYAVQIRLPGGNWMDVPGSPTYGTWIIVYNLAPGTTYEWRVRACCGYGQYSDWTNPVQFTTLGSSCDPPGWLGTTNITQTSATFEWDAVPGAVSYTVQKRITGGTWYDLPGSPFTGTWVNVTGLQSGTAYEWRVKSNCGNGMMSAWSAIAYFTTLGYGGNNNDECSDAVELAVNSYCVSTAATNVNATLSYPPPTGYCFTNNHKDVWFRFTMPNTYNPVVTIRTTAGSLHDAVMEVYKGPDCGSLYFLDCEDDNLDGNGSTMPVISIYGYAGATIWVRVWGYNGQTGTFNICVFDHFSSSYSDVEDESTPDAGVTLNPDQKEKLHAPVESESDALQVMPNPVSDLLTVSYLPSDGSRITGMTLTDLSGKQVLTKSLAGSDTNGLKEQVDVSGLADGIYILHISTTAGIQSRKIVVAH
ncbi:MAG TPA: fibronectin type III domain-containing protein [Saprospiraceae bacterium]|nr:fibronectin type III domain-containing protein [Saprospiraceae bacterium]